MKDFYIIVDSDPQFGYLNNLHIRRSKSQNIEFVKKINKTEKLKGMFVCGDLTERNSDGKKFFWYRYGGTKNEIEPLKKEYIEPILNEEIELHLIPGNHDHIISDYRFPFFYKPSINLIKNLKNLNFLYYQIGDCVYSFDIEGIHFCALDIYPNKKVCEWLKKDLEKIKGKPTVVFQHYDCDSDKWTQKEKDRFWNTIKDHNVFLILEGHNHNTYLNKYFHGIQRLNSAGKGLCVVHFINTAEGGDVNIYHITNEKDIDNFLI